MFPSTEWLRTVQGIFYVSYLFKKNPTVIENKNNQTVIRTQNTAVQIVVGNVYCHHHRQGKVLVVDTYAK